MEFCSDLFLLPFGGGMPHVDTIDLDNDCFVVGGSYSPPVPRMNFAPVGENAGIRDRSYYEMLVNRLEFNNNLYVHDVLSRHGQQPQPAAMRSATLQPHYASRLLPPRVPPKPKPPPPVRRNFLAPIYESREFEQFI